MPRKLRSLTALIAIALVAALASSSAQAYKGGTLSSRPMLSRSSPPKGYVQPRQVQGGTMLDKPTFGQKFMMPLDKNNSVNSVKGTKPQSRGSKSPPHDRPSILNYFKLAN